MKKALWLLGLVLALGGGLSFFWRQDRGEEPEVKARVATATTSEVPLAASGVGGPVSVAKAMAAANSLNRAVEAPLAEEAAQVAEERPQEDAEEKLVEAFDALTDRWQEPQAQGVDVRAAADFAAQLRCVPAARREECLQRALNLVPDENVMVLAGVLWDTQVDPALVELTFNDILNRSEEVKKPILQMIFQDKQHPCWADTAWILDVTGELPGKNEAVQK